VNRVAALLLFVALGAVILLWALAERQFKRRFLAMTMPVRPGEQVDQMTWDQKMVIVRRHELLNWGVAFALLLVLGGFVTLGHSHYVAIMRNTDPPLLTRAGPNVAGAVPGTVVYWSARFPGGRMWPAVEDGGYTLVRAVRGRQDQYLLFAPTGDLLWSGERVSDGPAPRVAIGAGGEDHQGCAVLAIEQPDGSARLLVIADEGTVRRQWHIAVYPLDDDSSLFSLKTSEPRMRSRDTSPDGLWMVSSRLLPSLSLISSHLNLFGPPPSAPCVGQP
jgi:hypothetical protein